MDKTPPPRRWVLSGPDFPVYREAFPDNVLASVEGDVAVLYVAGVAAFAANAEDILRRFARSEALRVLHLWDAPDNVRRWLKTGDESLRAAAVDLGSAAPVRGQHRDGWAAARAAARAATIAAPAWDAAWAAARAAADAAWDAARDAAKDAARAAAWDAAARRLVGELDGMLTGDGANTVEVG